MSETALKIGDRVRFNSETPGDTCKGTLINPKDYKYPLGPQNSWDRMIDAVTEAAKTVEHIQGKLYWMLPDELIDDYDVPFYCWADELTLLSDVEEASA